MPFSKFGLHADILRGVKDLAFTHPTPIQAQAIPPAMDGHDVLACAQTGSGKTAAFMLPTIHRLMAKATHGPRRCRALVLTPTRELAMQILENLNSLAVHTPISGAVIIGGMSMGPQAHAFRTGTEILIATPGRLLDHMKQPYARFDGLEVLIMDEADRMLDMGFLPDIRRILKLLPTKRQTLFFSATMPQEIRTLTQEMLRNPTTIQIDRQGAPAAGITQAIYPVAMHLKSQLLYKLLENNELDSVICFTRTKHRANRLAAFLEGKGIPCAPIHGNRSMGQRTAALTGFKNGRFRVLVATDIAARGIDIADVSHVINFDCPHVPEDYIHRVGRTGRAAATGDAYTFVSPEEEHDLRTIERVIAKRLPRITLPDFDYNARPTEALEIPIAQRIAAIRAQKAAQRAKRGPQQFGQPGGARPPRQGGAPHRGGSHPQASGGQNAGHHPGTPGAQPGSNSAGGRPGGNFSGPQGGGKRFGGGPRGKPNNRGRRW